jgi:hypothetical protein
MEMAFPETLADSVAAGLLGGGLGEGVWAAAKMVAARRAMLVKICFMGVSPRGL